MTIPPKGLPLPAVEIRLALFISANRENRIEIRMKRFLFGTLALLCLAGCTTQTNPTPEQIRQDAAKATSTTVQDVKAAAKGVADGIKQQKGSPDRRAMVDINRASADDLQTLPGIDGAHARKIVDNRPYGDPSDLVKKHVVSGAEFDRISDKIVAQ